MAGRHQFAESVLMRVRILQEGVIVNNFRLPVLLGLFVAYAASAAVAQPHQDAADSLTAGGPAFLTSMPVQEPSLFESAITQKNVELEQRIQRLETELNSIHGQRTVDPSCCIEQRLLQQEAGSGGLYGAVELTFLQPSVSGAQSVFGFTTGRMLDTDYQSAIRYILGYVNDSGLGVRARYWSFDNTSGFVPPYAPAVFGINVRATDVEITLAQRMRHWDLDVSGGLRYGKLQYSNPVLTLYNPGTVTFEGGGPTASLNGRRILGNSGLSVFGNVRGSIMIGDIRTASLLVNVPRGTIQDEVMTVFENQLGVAWNHSLPNDIRLEVRAAWETQYWMSSTLADDFYGVGSNLALMGPTVGFELRY